MSTRCIRYANKIIMVSCFIGIIMSVYMLHVEKKLETTKDYKAMCDISDRINCSKVFRSKHARGLGLLNENSKLNLPNSAYAILFYALVGLMTMKDNIMIARIQLLLSFLAIVVSTYLANILLTVLKDACVLCIGTYSVNAVCFLYTYKKYKELMCLQCERYLSD